VGVGKLAAGLSTLLLVEGLGGKVAKIKKTANATTQTIPIKM
jgi:hypothetical protein